jgi:hypothetical protein
MPKYMEMGKRRKLFAYREANLDAVTQNILPQTNRDPFAGEQYRLHITLCACRALPEVLKEAFQGLCPL